MEVGKDKLPSWPSDKLMVYAEHSSLFYDTMTDRVVEQVKPLDIISLQVARAVQSSRETLTRGVNCMLLFAAGTAFVAGDQVNHYP